MTPPPTTTPPATPTTPGTPAAPGQNNSKAIIALVLGILSLVCCGLFAGIPAIFVARSELKSIDEGLSPETNRTLAKVSLILGIIGTVLSALGILIYAAIFIIAIVSGTQAPATF